MNAVMILQLRLGSTTFIPARHTAVQCEGMGEGGGSAEGVERATRAQGPGKWRAVGNEVPTGLDSKSTAWGVMEHTHAA